MLCLQSTKFFYFFNFIFTSLSCFSSTLEGADIIKQHFKKVFKSIIRNTVAITEAAAQETDVITYKPSSPGAADFISLAKEIIKIK